MKTEIIATDTPVEAKPNDGDAFRWSAGSKRKPNVTQADYLSFVRSSRIAREVHSDGFLAITHQAKECTCGGCALYSDNYICPRCGKAN